MINKVLLSCSVLFLLVLCGYTSAFVWDFGCNAAVTLLSGEKIHLTSAGVGVVNTDRLGFGLNVSYNDGNAVLDIRKIRSMNRLPPFKLNKQVYMLKFAFETIEGQKGVFRINSKNYIGGEIPIGDWRVTMDEVQNVTFDCKTLD